MNKEGDILSKKIVGVIGGLGPQATIYFMNLVVKNTCVTKDQDHIDMIVFNHASIPDRTAFILDKSNDDPAPYLMEDCKKLCEFGCSFIVMPCNTAHYFYEKINEVSTVPVVNIIRETVSKCKNCKKVGIMATDGTLFSRAYQDELSKNNIPYFIPERIHQETIMKYIYDYVKIGKNVDIEQFNLLVQYFLDNECDKIIIGCTELSIIVEDNNIRNDNIVDSLLVLANKTIELASERKQ